MSLQRGTTKVKENPGWSKRHHGSSSIVDHYESRDSAGYFDSKYVKRENISVRLDASFVGAAYRDKVENIQQR